MRRQATGWCFVVGSFEALGVRQGCNFERAKPTRSSSNSSGAASLAVMYMCWPLLLRMLSIEGSLWPPAIGTSVVVALEHCCGCVRVGETRQHCVSTASLLLRVASSHRVSHSTLCCDYLPPPLTPCRSPKLQTTWPTHSLRRVLTQHAFTRCQLELGQPPNSLPAVPVPCTHNTENGSSTPTRHASQRELYKQSPQNTHRVHD